MLNTLNQAFLLGIPNPMFCRIVFLALCFLFYLLAFVVSESNGNDFAAVITPFRKPFPSEKLLNEATMIEKMNSLNACELAKVEEKLRSRHLTAGHHAMELQQSPSHALKKILSTTYSTMGKHNADKQRDLQVCDTTIDKGALDVCVAVSTCDLTCVDNTIDYSQTTCNGIADSICAAMINCGCLSCRYELLHFLGCYFGCIFSCELPACTIETETAGDCTYYYAPGCVQCLIEVGKTIEVPTSCSSLNAQLCNAFDVCYCESCIDTLENYYSCTQAESGCQIDCSNIIATPSPTPRPAHPCDSDYYVFQECALNQNPACEGCLFDAYEDIFGDATSVLCSYFESQFCQAINNCGCDACESSARNAYLCIVGCPYSPSCEAPVQPTFPPIAPAPPDRPTRNPVATKKPTLPPISLSPTRFPMQNPTDAAPVISPITLAPSESPTLYPIETGKPTFSPMTPKPTMLPTQSLAASENPTLSPITFEPTAVPSASPSILKTVAAPPVDDANPIISPRITSGIPKNQEKPILVGVLSFAFLLMI